MKKQAVVCENCKSDEIIADADAVWDVEKQDWIVQDIWLKGGRCDACGDMDARWEFIDYDATEPDAEFVGTRRRIDAKKNDRVCP